MPPASRFVVLEHRWEGIHWDFMLERGESLRTWAIDGEIGPAIARNARSLPDHRPIYLEYEGPISGGRGQVRRVASGTYQVIQWDDDHVLARLDGDQLIGIVELRRLAGEIWSFFLPGKVD